MRTGTIELSVVIPVYNSADIFPELYARLRDSLTPAVASFEVIAVLDGCTDRSYEVISGVRTQDGRVRLIELSRNFGHQAAITAGLQYAAGDLVIIMDDDLEDPPEVLPQLIARLREGFDVVYGVRRSRKRSALHRLVYSLFYRVLGSLADIRIPADAGDFCIMRRSVVDALNRMPESNRFLRGLRAWSGFRQTGFEYARGGRFAGESGYSFRKYLSLAMTAIFSFSYRPLAVISVLGALTAALSFLAGVAFIILKMTGHIADVPGWTSLAVLLLFLSGVQMLTTGIIGSYIARVYEEVKHRPMFLVSRSEGFEQKERP
jgi:dolichol-phosphate mannosyltransferase